MSKNHMEVWGDVLNQYFESHFRHRFLILNIFIIVTTSLVIVAYFSTKICSIDLIPWALIFLGSFMALITYIFWNFEKRTKFLIKHCEKVFIEYENKQENLTDKMKLFANEISETENAKKEMKCCSSRKLFSYSGCINALLLTFCIGYIILLVFIYLHQVNDCTKNATKHECNCQKTL